MSQPWSVAMAALSMRATAVVAVANAVVAGVGVHLFNSMFRRRAAPLGVADGLLTNTEVTVRVGLVATAVVMVAAAIALWLLGTGVRRGRPGARSGLWAGGALVAIFALVTVCGSVVSRSTITVTDGDAHTEITTELVRAAQTAVPAWFGVVIGGLSGVIVLGYIAASILLAGPAARSYFAQRRPSP